MKRIQSSEQPESFWIRKRTDTEAVVRLRADIRETESGWSWNEVETTIQLQSSLEQYIQDNFWDLWDKAGGGFPLVTKFAFRQLLTPSQKMVFDNFDLLAETLGLTSMQVMQLRIFKADFDSAIKVNMQEPTMIQGLQAIASWNLELDSQPVFTEADVDRILAGIQPL